MESFWRLHVKWIMRERVTTIVSLLIVSTASMLFLCAPAFSQSSPAAGPWAGWVQCDHDVQNQGYQRRETQTWKITQSTPVGMNGTLMHLYSATWGATGKGSINRTDNNQRTFTGQWTIDVTPPKDIQMVIWVRPDGKLVIRQWGIRQRAEHAVTGTRQVSISGAPPSSINIDHAVTEWIFPVILEAPTSTHISGSNENQVESANAELMPQFAPQHNATCKWEFARGANASVPPPPGDTTASNPPGSNPPAAIQLSQPHGGETWLAGTLNNITWTNTFGVNQLFDIDFSSDGGQTWSTLSHGMKPTEIDATAHTVNAFLRMPQTTTNTGRVRVSKSGNSAGGTVSSAFSLVTPSVAVTSPAQGASMQVGSDTDITWSINGGSVYPAKVEISRNGGTTWEDNGTIVPVGSSTRELGMSPAPFLPRRKCE